MPSFRATLLACVPLALLVAAASAHAATAQWTCGASAATATIAGQSPVNPVTTTRTPCADQSTGLPNTTDALGLAPGLTAKSAYAITSAKPPAGRPLEQSVGGAAGVEDLSFSAGPTAVIGVEAAQSEVTGICRNGGPVITGTSMITGITLNGRKLTLDRELGTLTNQLSAALGVLITIKLNEQVSTAKENLLERAAHITVVPAAGGAPLADVVVAESSIASASACDPAAVGNAGPTPAPPTDADPGVGARVCPDGAQLDAKRGLCVIPASASGGQGTVVIGRPYTGPSGGKVISLTDARRKYKSACVKGSGPKYAIVGTSKADRITGTNGPDRILGLAGNDALDGGRGNDCIDGGSGNDNANGGIGSDRVYGLAGNDHLNGGPGTDRLSGGSGNDTINSGFGAGRVYGGPGRDFINVATAGPHATVDCGRGRDKVRLNRNERRHTKGCETRYVFNDK